MRDHPLFGDSERRALVAAMLVTVSILIVGLFASPDRIWAAWLVAVVLLAGLGLAGPVFIAVHCLCAARWGDPILPVARAMGAGLLPAAAAALLVVFGLSSLYEWSHPAFLDSHPIVAGKRGWLNVPFFLVRGAAIFAIWLLTARWVSARQGRGSAGIFVILFAVTFSVFSFDWIMSIEPEWFSTMFAVYNFSGLFLAGLAMITLLVLRARSRGHLVDVGGDTLHDLGRLMFAFAFFWGYIWFCQYMLIWYTNIPEETAWFARRHAGSWGTLSLLNLALNFLVPFIVLLPATAKRSPRVLGRVAATLLVGRWLDLYVMVTPVTAAEQPPLGLWELAPPLAAFAGFFLLADHSLRRLEGTPRRSAVSAPVPA